MTRTNLLKTTHPLKGMFIPFLWVLLCMAAASAQISRTPGPSETALAGSVTARTDNIWHVLANPALPAGERPLIAGFFVPPTIGIQGYHEGTMLALVPVTTGARLGLAGSSLGAGAYRESRATLIAAIDAPGGISLGTAISYYALAIDGYGTAQALALDLGALMNLATGIRFGAAIHNPFRARIADTDLPQQVAFGFAFDIRRETTLSLDAHHELGSAACVGIGFSTVVLPGLELRTGIASAPATVAFGAGYEMDGFLFDCGSAYIAPLGFRHALGAGIRW